MVDDGDRLDDFHMAAISWLLLKEWDNPMWSEAARNSLLARLTILPWWLDDQGWSRTLPSAFSSSRGPLVQEASFTRMVWISSTGVRTTRWAGRCVEVSLIQTQVLRTVPGWPRLCLKSSAFRHHLPGKIFFLLTFWCQGSNSTGSALRAKGKERLMRWLDFRGRFGFSEYNADTYGPISFAPLVTVAALAPDPEVTPAH